MSAGLTSRQQAELEFYEEHARRYAPESVSFDPVLGRERRPWNPYWFVYEQARELYAAGARRALDFGCGKGVVSIRLASIGYEVAGFDISPGNIEVARRLAVRYGFEGRTSFSVQVAESLDYPGNSFDLVVGMDILHHVELPAAVGEAMRVLKPGGTAIFREHIEVPFLERLRHSRVGRWLVPPGESLDRNVTRFERKLSRGDLEAIRRLCPQMRIRRFTLTARMVALAGSSADRWQSRLERFDQRLFHWFPPASRLGATAVITLLKPALPAGC